MVAYDPRRPADPARSLTPELRDAFREALHAQWRSPDAMSDALTEVVRRVAGEARARGVRPEELIIDIKGAADMLAEESQIASRTRHRVREWIVSACVKAYFSDDR